MNYDNRNVREEGKTVYLIRCWNFYKYVEMLGIQL